MASKYVYPATFKLNRLTGLLARAFKNTSADTEVTISGLDRNLEAPALRSFEVEVKLLKLHGFPRWAQRLLIKNGFTDGHTEVFRVIFNPEGTEATFVNIGSGYRIGFKVLLNSDWENLVLIAAAQISGKYQWLLNNLRAVSDAERSDIIIIPDPVEPPVEPPIDPPVEPPSGIPTGAKLHKVFSKDNPWGVTTILGHRDGLFVTVRNRDTKRNSELWRLRTDNGNFERVFRDGSETYVTPCVWEGRIYWPVEHGEARPLIWDNGQFRRGAPMGRWSVLCTIYNGRPCCWSNNKYKARQMQDHPVLRDCETGEKVLELPMNTFVMAGRQGSWACSFGAKGLYDEQGKKLTNDTIEMPSLSTPANALLGSGAAYSQSGDTSQGNSEIFILKRSIGHLGCAIVDEIRHHDGLWYAVGGRPNTLAVVTNNDVRVLLRGSNHERGSFGMSLSSWRGDLYVAESHNRGFTIHRVEFKYG